ncbi:MAG: hypothetical protein LUD22_01345 [Coprobacillus sp.]|nr:hypothetical protein [Coprobacillus sp.]
MNKEDLVPGTLYIIKDSFFKKVKDPYLMCNHKGKGIRPEVFLFIEVSNGLAVMAPVSSKTTKYDTQVKKLKSSLKQTNNPAMREELSNKVLGLLKSKINGVPGYILLQNMFVLNTDYIRKEYLGFGGVAVSLSLDETKNLINQARKVYDLLKSGFKFISTQPDFNRIEQIMILESKKDK